MEGDSDEKPKSKANNKKELDIDDFFASLKYPE